MKQEDSAENSGPKHLELKKIDTKCKSSFLIQQKKKKKKFRTTGLKVSKATFQFWKHYRLRREGGSDLTPN